MTIGSAVDLEVALAKLNLAGHIDGAAFANNGHSVTQNTSLALDLDAIVQELLLNTQTSPTI